MNHPNSAPRASVTHSPEVPDGVETGRLLSARDEGHDDVGGVAVEVLAAPVVDGGGARIGVARSDLHVPQRHSSIQGGHDEGGSQDVRVDQSEPGTLPDRAYSAVCSAPVEALTVSSAQDRTLATLTDSQVDGPCGARHQRDDGGLAALAEDPQRPVAALDADLGHRHADEFAQA